MRLKGDQFTRRRADQTEKVRDAMFAMFAMLVSRSTSCQDGPVIKLSV